VSLIVICFPVLFNHRLASRALTKRSYIPSAKGPTVFQGMTYKKDNKAIRKGLKMLLTNHIHINEV